MLPSLAGVSPIQVLLRRVRWLVLGVVLTFLILFARLWHLQVVRGDEYYQTARENVVKEKTIDSVRGRILDRQGRVLAANKPSFRILAKASLLDDRAAWERFGQLLALTEDERALVAKRLRRFKKHKRTSAGPVLLHQSRERAALVAQQRLHLPGVAVQTSSRRDYPEGRTLAHVLGFMNLVNAEDLEALEAEGYRADERIGRRGVEGKWEASLRGEKGRERFVVNSKRQRVEDSLATGLIKGPRRTAPVPGLDVYLTMDLRLQKIAEKAVARHAAAAVVVLDVSSGRVLAHVSTPNFDPNSMTSGASAKDMESMSKDPRKPFLDKTLRQHYPPGSTYKFVAAVAALEDGVAGRAETCTGSLRVGARLFRCTKKHDDQTLIEAIQHSCNVYFWKLAEQVGIDRMAEVARDFGFGEWTGIGMNGDVPGRVPTRDWYEEHQAFKVGYTLNAAVGQGDVEVTVMQLAAAYAAIANGGRLLMPQLIERIETHAGRVVQSFRPQLRRQVNVSPGTLALLREGMTQAVNSPGGTAYEYGRSDRVRYAGKTGTAQVRSRRRGNDEGTRGWDPQRDHAWFAGFAPAERPEIAIVVLIEHGGSGGKVAAPVAKQIVEGYFAEGARL